jgi:SAM-dependent methyltransferase
MTKSLDLGSGPTPKNPFGASEVFGIDVREDLEKNILCADLAVEKIPFGDDVFDFVSAFDFLEHVPRILYLPARRNAFVELMNEIFRVLKPGGFFLSSTPVYPHPAAFRDPTHVNIITEETFSLYFDWQHRLAAPYGFYGSFLVAQQEVRGAHLFTILRKVVL